MRLVDSASGVPLIRSGTLVFEPKDKEAQQNNDGTITAWGLTARIYNRITVCKVRRYSAEQLLSVQIRTARPTVPDPVRLVRGKLFVCR